jgi:hypothetical protein
LAFLGLVMACDSTFFSIDRACVFPSLPRSMCPGPAVRRHYSQAHMCLAGTSGCLVSTERDQNFQPTFCVPVPSCSMEMGSVPLCSSAPKTPPPCPCCYYACHLEPLPVPSCLTIASGFPLDTSSCTWVSLASAPAFLREWLCSHLHWEAGRDSGFSPRYVGSCSGKSSGSVVIDGARTTVWTVLGPSVHSQGRGQNPLPRDCAGSLGLAHLGISNKILLLNLQTVTCSVLVWLNHVNH